MKYIAPALFFLAVAAVSIALEWRSRNATRVGTCVESARILIPNANAHECAPGASVTINVIQFGHGENASEYAAVSCSCPGASLWMAGMEAR